MNRPRHLTDWIIVLTFRPRVCILLNYIFIVFVNNNYYSIILHQFRKGFDMASLAQVEANRVNAQKSTGPRTVEGKAKVSQNGVRHGFTARQDVIAGESQEAFDVHREEVLAELTPVGKMETALAERVVSLMWRLKRAERLQNESIDMLTEKLTSGPLAKLTRTLEGKATGDRQDDDLTLGRVAVRDFSNARVLEKLLMYERRLEQSLYKTLAELNQLRLMRGLNSESAAAKEDQICKAKPISAEANPSQHLDTETVIENLTANGPEKAKPIQTQTEPEPKEQRQIEREVERPGPVVYSQPCSRGTSGNPNGRKEGHEGLVRYQRQEHRHHRRSGCALR